MAATSATSEPASQTRIQSVSRAIQLLLAIAEADNGVTAKDLAERFDLSLPTTYHLLTTLWAEGMILKDDQRGYRLGSRVGAIVDGYQRINTVPLEYRRALKEVVDRIGETAYVSAWRDNSVKVLLTAEGVHAVRVVGLQTGYSDNLHARASGKLLLAMMPSERREQILHTLRMRRLTPNTIVSKSALKAELDMIRESGLAFDRQEFQLGVDCVSAPIRDGKRVEACITVSVPTQRFEDERDRITSTLTEVTSRMFPRASDD